MHTHSYSILITHIYTIINTFTLQELTIIEIRPPAPPAPPPIITHGPRPPTPPAPTAITIREHPPAKPDLPSKEICKDG
jgi:hypothetical protein